MICWVTPSHLTIGKCLAFVGWVEARNPTKPIGLNLTYQYVYFSFRFQLKRDFRTNAETPARRWKIIFFFIIRIKYIFNA